MSKTLKQIAEELKDSNKKVQLIYAFNGTGKTRLSREFKNLIEPETKETEEQGGNQRKFLYYNAFTEDLFYWDNDLEADNEPKLKIQPNAFTAWLITLLKEQGQDQNITANFQHYSNSQIIPLFNEEYKYKETGSDGAEIEINVPAFSEITFSKLNVLEQEISMELGDRIENIKISKGEESNFIWSVFYTLLDQIIDILDVPDPENRETREFDSLEYVFIDDPVSSLDENHLIQLAVDLGKLTKKAPTQLKFVITTHNPLFYNVLYSELKLKCGYILSKFDDEIYGLEEKRGSANKAFSYHLHIKNLIEQAIEQNNVQRHHFMLLRNLYEKTASFLGYKEWADLLDTVEGDKKAYFNRIVQFSSHSKLTDEEISEPTEPEKKIVKKLFENLIDNYGVWYKEEENA